MKQQSSQQSHSHPKDRKGMIEQIECEDHAQCFLWSLKFGALGVVRRGQMVNQEFYLAILWHTQALQKKWLETWWNTAALFTNMVLSSHKFL